MLAQEAQVKIAWQAMDWPSCNCTCTWGVVSIPPQLLERDASKWSARSRANWWCQRLCSIRPAAANRTSPAINLLLIGYYTFFSTLERANWNLPIVQHGRGPNYCSISLPWRLFFNIATIHVPKCLFTQKKSLTSSALELICSLYHKELQYIAKIRQITIDLDNLRLVTIETSRNHNSSQHQIVFAIVDNYVGIGKRFLYQTRGWVFKSH